MRKVLFLLPVTLFFLTSCVTTNRLTKGERYANLYSEKPTTILVMPPINNTTNVEAKELLYTSINKPLMEAGYYVISPFLSLDILKEESAYDAELFIDKDLSMFSKVFGADAIVFSVIDKWEKEGLGIRTNIRYVIKSTHTNEILYDRRCDLFLSTQVQSNGNSALSLLVDLAATVATTALTDHIVAARRCNYYVFKDLPKGKYSPDFQMDLHQMSGPQSIKANVK